MAKPGKCAVSQFPSMEDVDQRMLGGGRGLRQFSKQGMTDGSTSLFQVKLCSVNITHLCPGTLATSLRRSHTLENRDREYMYSELLMGTYGLPVTSMCLRIALWSHL